MEITLGQLPMSRFMPLADAQDEAALCECGRCFGEIYRLDPVGEVGGVLFHVDCMTAEEQEFYRMAPAFALFQEEY